MMLFKAGDCRDDSMQKAASVKLQKTSGSFWTEAQVHLPRFKTLENTILKQFFWFFSHICGQSARDMA